MTEKRFIRVKNAPGFALRTPVAPLFAVPSLSREEEPVLRFEIRVPLLWLPFFFGIRWRPNNSRLRALHSDEPRN